LHGQTPKSKNSVIFASNDSGKIGKKSSCADLHVVEKGIPVMEMKGKSTTVLERLLDSSGHTVGRIVVGFNYTVGCSPLELKGSLDRKLNLPLRNRCTN
jgi:hypothetical protein